MAQGAKYLPMMKEIFREEGLPGELAYLPLIESSFNPLASAGGKCVGLWQFLEGTGRKYGLRIDAWVDERRDPERSTRAAARYFRDLYAAFRSWDLAIAAYNAGEGSISDALARRNATSYWELAKYPDMPRATREFVPKFMAAMKLAQDPQGHGLEGLPPEEGWRFDRVTLSRPLDLETIARLAGTTEKEIRALNPHIKGRSSPPTPGGEEIRVPEGTGDAVQSKLAGLSGGGPEKGPWAARSLEPSVRVHRIRPGDTIGGIARQYGTGVREIESLNLLRPGQVLKVGRQIHIPVPDNRGSGAGGKTEAGGQARAAGATVRPGGHAPAPDGVRGHARHEVKAGENLWTISRRYGVSVPDLLHWNGLQKSSLVRPGMILTVGP
jgi:membrane-bound lytic murein transglycosylase D